MLRTKLRYPSSQPSHKGGSDDDNKVINVDENDEDDEEQEDQDLEADKKEEDLTETRRSKKLSLPPLPLSLPSSRAFSTREKVVGLKDAGTLSSSWKARRNEFLRNSCVTNVSTDTIAIPKTTSTTIEDKEKNARDKENRNPFSLLLLGNLAALKVMVLYLISLETIITCSLTAWLIIFWYQLAQDHEGKGQKWTGGSMDFIILAFAVISPVSKSRHIVVQTPAPEEVSHLQLFCH